MGWFSKAKRDGVIVPKKPNLEWEPMRHEFTERGLEDLNPHLGSYIVEVKDLIPEKYHKRVFLAGGFAANVAGITKEFRDVDIFCDSDATFDKLLQLFQQNESVEQVAELLVREEYGRLWKYQVGKQRFDLIDITPSARNQLDIVKKRFDLIEITPSTRNQLDIVDILKSFDINWCMAGITLADVPKLWVHPEAFSPYVRVCKHRTLGLKNASARVEKYSERVINADVSYAKKVIKALDIYLAGQVQTDSYWTE